MTTHLRFLYVCDREFDRLPGEDPQQRRCDTCATTVHNVDAMTAEQRAGLLHGAAERATTVCVSVSLPEGAARACRAGQPVAANQPAPEPDDALLHVVGRIDVDEYRRPPPARGEPDTMWQSFPVDLPAVRAELEAMAPAFALRLGPDDVWFVSEPAHDRIVDVVAVADGQATAVGVRIAPPPMHQAPPAMSARQLLGLVGTFVLAPLWLILAFSLWLADLPALWILLGPTMVVLLLTLIVAGFLAVTAIGERARRRAIDRWSAGWHRRFWPALTARLADGQPYR